jgi:hypothetical protein
VNWEAVMERRQLAASCLGIALLVLLTGCFVLPHQRLHPPAWIHGEWGIASDPESMSYTFTASTVIQRAMNISLNLGEMYRLTETSVAETITDTLYSFTTLDETGYTTMEFVRIDANTISFTMSTNVVTIGPVTLSRL